MLCHDKSTFHFSYYYLVSATGLLILKDWLPPFILCEGMEGRADNTRLKHAHKVGGSPVAWASCLGPDGEETEKHYVQVCIVPGVAGTGEVTVTGKGGGAAAVERVEVAISWIYSRERDLARLLGLPTLVRSLRAHNHGIHVHLCPALQPKHSSLLGVTMAIALLSLAAGRLAWDGIAILGELRLDGARASWIHGLSKAIISRCRPQGISKIVTGIEQVSRAERQR